MKDTWDHAQDGVGGIAPDQQRGRIGRDGGGLNSDEERLAVSASAPMLLEALRSSLELLHAASYSAPLAASAESVDKGTLLQQCLQLCELHRTNRVEPIRTLHHFACTGGTLISRCIAALPNVQLLSEVDPLSKLLMPTGAKPTFAPTDMVALLRQSTRGTHAETLISLFRSEITTVYEECCARGERLVLRDHAHSHFCEGVSIGERPSLRAMLPNAYPAVSLVTVRHPLDSFASLMENGWIHFEPGTIDDYCRRYLAFIGCYRDVHIERYEDFVSNPLVSMQRICKTLALPFSDHFIDLFPAFTITGDSGRSANTIQQRPSRPAAIALEEEASRSGHFWRLIDILGYGPAAGQLSPL